MSDAESRWRESMRRASAFGPQDAPAGVVVSLRGELARRRVRRIRAWAAAGLAAAAMVAMAVALVSMSGKPVAPFPEVALHSPKPPAFAFRKAEPVPVAAAAHVVRPRTRAVNAVAVRANPPAARWNDAVRITLPSSTLAGMGLPVGSKAELVLDASGRIAGVELLLD